MSFAAGEMIINPLIAEKLPGRVISAIKQRFNYFVACKFSMTVLFRVVHHTVRRVSIERKLRNLGAMRWSGSLRIRTSH